MKKEDLIKENEESVLDVLHNVDAQASTAPRQVVENKDSCEEIKDESGESSYLLDLVTSLDEQEKKLTMSQTAVQALLGETDELLSEYKVSVKTMKDKLADRKTKLGKLK